MLILRGFVVWVVLISAEILHGIARNILFTPLVGDFRARQIGVFTGSIIIFTIAFLCVRWLRASRASELLLVGFLWLFLTISFEVLFGRFVLHYSWERIVSDYNVIDGGFLPFGMAVLTLSPLITGKMRKVI